ncbi:stage V sporulation protein D, partial [bacterium]|nr:stage V sporulation protein D [bacterium]
MFVAIIAKLIYTQIANAESLQIMALDQWTRDVPITGERRDIFDKNGTLLADTDTLYTVYARPVSITNKEYTANVLAKVLSKNKENLLSKINSKVSEITVSKKVTKEQMVALTKSGVTGVYFSQNLNRKYIYGDFMTQILGFVNVDGMGQSGVEAYYNDYLKGVDGYVLTETDLVGREIDSNVTRYIAGKKGNSVYLTLDYAISSIVENAVSAAYQKYNATNASCIVMNVKTGEIVAMAQKPSYDLNDLPRDDIGLLFERSKSLLVSSVYEPGSTFKILTAAIGLESGVIDTDYHFYCPGYKIVDGKKIKCWKTTGHGSQDFVKGVQNSCNVLFMDTALKIGAERFYEEIEKFGLNSKTGIDMSGEASGLVISKEAVKTVDLARMGFGQAIAVTPIELLTACAAVVNGGKLMKPYIVDKIVDR